MYKYALNLFLSISLSLNYLYAEFDYVTVPPGADPSVSADEGGIGFEEISKSLGYTTLEWKAENEKYFGDSRAIKGGTLRDPGFGRYPANLRILGKESNYVENLTIERLCYESLLERHPLTWEYSVPRLASHWKISDNKKIYRFRINPDARWSDGRRVTAEDVVSTWFLRMDETILSPDEQVKFDKFEEPVAESMYIVRVEAKEMLWENFDIFAEMSILPAYYVDQVDGSEFLDKYQFKMIPGSGPYIIKNEDIVNQESYKMTRRKDFWGKDLRQNLYRFNFDAISFFIIKDNDPLIFEKVKKGEFDYMTVLRSRVWVEECTSKKIKAVDKGWMKKHRIFAQRPPGTSGYGFNMRKFPFDDINIRYAFGYLYDREKMNRDMYYSEYEMMHSWASGTMYENENNPKILYNPEKAVEHLKLAGFEHKNEEGILINDNGQTLSFEIAIEKGHAYMVTPVQNMLKQYGIDMQIINMDGTTEWKNRNERNFQIYLHSFTGSVHPLFERWFRSDLADMNDNNNFFGLKDERIDKLVIDYNKEFNLDKRIEIGKELDKIICEIHPVSFGIKRLFTRLLFWDKFSYPEYMLDRFEGDYDSIYNLWWFDPEKVNQLEKAMENDTQLPVSEIDIKFWPDWIEKQK